MFCARARFSADGPKTNLNAQIQWLRVDIKRAKGFRHRLRHQHRRVDMVSQDYTVHEERIRGLLAFFTKSVSALLTFSHGRIFGIPIRLRVALATRCSRHIIHLPRGEPDPVAIYTFPRAEDHDGIRRPI